MSTENTVLLANITTDSTPGTFSYGDKKKAAGYHKISDGTHTAIYTFNSFAGTVKIQGTLALYPSDTDWFDIDNTEIGGDSTVIGGVNGTNISFTRNFTGNFLWIRAAYNLQSGSIIDVRFNY